MNDRRDRIPLNMTLRKTQETLRQQQKFLLDVADSSDIQLNAAEVDSHGDTGV